MAGVFSPAVVKDEETDEEDGVNKADHEEDVFMIILYPNEISENIVTLPRNNNTTFADLRREIEYYLDHLPAFEFMIPSGDPVTLIQEREWNYNKFGNVIGDGRFSNPFLIYLKQKTDVYMIIMYPNKSSEDIVTLPRNNNTTFANIRREIFFNLDHLPPFEFMLPSGPVAPSQEREWNYNKFGNIEGKGELSNPFLIYIRHQFEYVSVYHDDNFHRNNVNM